jgi:hypothetical protein
MGDETRPTRERGERERAKLDRVYCSSWRNLGWFTWHHRALGDFFSWAVRVAKITQI